MRLGCRGDAIGRAPMRACLRQHVAARAQVLEQRELQHARPRPELAHRQRRDRLEGADEALQPLRVEPAGARPDQLEGQGVDARQPGELVGGDARQPAEEGRREIVLDVARRGGDDVEVVEQPLGGRRHRLAARVLRERGVDLAQGLHVRLELAQVRAPLPRRRGDSDSMAARRRACSSSNSILRSSLSLLIRRAARSVRSILGYLASALTLQDDYRTELSGATVYGATSTGEALGQIAEVEPTVILYDLGMPLDDGYTFIAKLRAHHDDGAARIPAIALSAHASPEDRLRALTAGSQMHLAKPVNLDALTARGRAERPLA